MRSVLLSELIPFMTLSAVASATASTLIVDVQKMRIVTVDSAAEPAESREAEVVILGGSLGGVAAALAVCDAGRAVLLTEETDWLGGQATSQGVSALDENGHIERSGGTRSYLDFRTRIREWYRKDTTLTAKARQDPLLDPGNSWVSRLTFEPKVAVAVIDEMLAPHVASGRLKVLLRHKIARARREGDRVRSVDAVGLDSGRLTRLTGRYFLDATDLGEPLVVCGVEHVVGAESKEQTGEPYARADGPHPECVQSFTYTFALSRRSEPQPVVAKPADYERNREQQPYTFRHLYHDGRGWIRYFMFERGEGALGPFWTYRRLIDKDLFQDPRYRCDVAMINWPGNDYRGRSLLVDSPQNVLLALREAKDLSLGFCHWLQTEAPRDDDSGLGYPEMRLEPAVMDTEDGLSKYPYIRESRRIKALRTIVQQDVAAEFQKGPRAVHFADSVGIGLYGIDIHPNDAETKLPPAGTRPFQIALGALIPAGTANLLAACKNIGVTHITNGCYRLHPIEWNIGEAAGALAVTCIERDLAPHAIRADAGLILALQRRLVRRGVPIFWYDDVGPGDEDFEEAQMAPFASAGKLAGLAGSLHYHAPAESTK